MIGNLANQAPGNLEEADMDSLNEMFAGISSEEAIPAYASIAQPEYLLMGLGLTISLLSALNFARLVENKLNGWKEDQRPLLPLASIGTTISYLGVVFGVTLLIAGSMEVFDFAYGPSLLIGSLVSVLTGVAFWIQIKRLMGQVEAGNFKAVDFDNYDEFF
ncbi:MAG: hypothetical protein AB8A39_02160 [Prochlorococcus sp.]